MENMHKELTVPKWPKIPQNLFAQIVCPSPKVRDFDEKRLHWPSIVRVDAYSFVSTGAMKLHSFGFNNW